MYVDCKVCEGQGHQDFIKCQKCRGTGLKYKMGRPQKNVVGDKVIAVSGGFDPVHEGHLLLFKEAKALGSKLVVILNNDNWLTVKKGKPFMSEMKRAKILISLPWVDRVMITEHAVGDEDVSVCHCLQQLRPNVFANGGDRTSDNVPEVLLCKQEGIELVWGAGGGKVNSSSKLVFDAQLPH